MRRKLVLLGFVLGTAIATPAPEASAQAQPKPGLAPTPIRPVTTTAPRAGGFPMELALPLLGSGAAALGGGMYLLRRGRRPSAP